MQINDMKGAKKQKNLGKGDFGFNRSENKRRRGAGERIKGNGFELESQDNMMFDNNMGFEEQLRDDEIEVCETCKKSQQIGAIWIQCDECDKWYHACCEGLDENNMPG
mmetsp:Transcript_38032/g.36416  ORF Transcript_38032/g.36416 Transcript_38032/m.36416 type:complete len:108 (+) Transcript_38032:235-558(+)